MNINYFSAFCILLLITSCNSEEITDKKNYCQENLEYLFSVPDSIPQFEIDYGLSKDSIFDFIESHFQNDSCWHHRIFGLILDSNITVKVNYSKACPTDYYTIDCGGIYSKQFKVSLNTFGEIYMEGEISETNKIVSSVYNKYPHKYSSNVFSIIKWRNNTPSDTIKTVLKETVRGYSYCYEKLANDIFNKNLHQLNIRELDSITSILPFDLKILEIERNEFIGPPKLIQEIDN
jgi:hypothetical protein